MVRRIDEHSAFCAKCRQLKVDIEYYIEILEYEGRDIQMHSDKIIELKKTKYKPALNHIRFSHGYIYSGYYRMNLTFIALILVIILTILNYVSVIYWNLYFSLFLLLIGFLLGFALDKRNIKKDKHI